MREEAALSLWQPWEVLVTSWGAGQEAYGLWLPHKRGLGVSALVGGWGARSGDPSPASLSQQPLWTAVSALPNTPAWSLHQRSSSNDAHVMCGSDFPRGPSPLARLPARLHTRSL